MRKRMNQIRKKKKSILFSLLFVMVLFTFGCGKVKNGKALYQWAKNEYGDCTVVSMTEQKDETVVVLHDTLQDFDYEVTSSMSNIVIDGSDFGSLPNTTDTFDEKLKEKVISNAKDELDAVCNKEGMRYEPGFDYDGSVINIFAETPEDGKEAAIKCAEILQKQNKNNRLDSLCINVAENQYDDYYDNEHFGSVKLPDLLWRTPEEELAEYYTEMAQMQTDKNAVFLRSELKTFADTGADLERVVNVLGSDFPTESTSPVTFYYFKSSDGREYYLCDFNYYDEEYVNISYYTNYSEKE